MRVLRSILMVVFFIAGVFIAAANVHDVDLIYLPAVPLVGLTSSLSVHVPLFLIVLTSLVAGVLFGGLAAILEQARLRLGLRRARKDADRALQEEGKAVALLDNAKAEAAGLQAEIAELREELRAAGEVVTSQEPLSAFRDSAPDERYEPDAADSGDSEPVSPGDSSPDK